VRLPPKRFLHSMGVASILAGIILIGLAKVQPMIQRLVRKV
jgi:hypothetical protein